MSDKKLNAIKEIEFRVNRCKEICTNALEGSDEINLFTEMDKIDSWLFDINDFINDLKDTDETN